MELPDIQNNKTNYGKKIKKVGVRNVYSQIHFDGMKTFAKTSSYVSLIDNKGIHMSRLLEALNEEIWNLDTTDDVKLLLDNLEKKNKEFSEDSFVKFGFSYIKEHEAPSTYKNGFVKYDIKLSCKKLNGKYKYILELFIPYTSLCPCSKEISDYGAHNQRSLAHISISLNTNHVLGLTKYLINRVRDCGSSRIYSVLKRSDEKFVTEEAYNNPKFVEDTIRDIGVELDTILDKSINDYSVVVENYESIHQHNALAIINAGRDLK